MFCDRSCQTFDAATADIFYLRSREVHEKRTIEQNDVPSRFAYRMRLGRETIFLNPIEYCILTFLAARPYRPFTKQRIANAVTSDRHPVSEATLDRHIRSLRGKLGFFRDYVQRVPYIGYRFKA